LEDKVFMKTHAMLIAAVLAFTTTPAFAQKEPLKDGDKAPKLEAEAWFNLPKGMKTLNPSDLKGQIIIAEFWATWCGPCQRSVPHLADIQKKFRTKGVILVALSTEGDSVVQPFIEKYKVPYIIGSGAGITTRAYGVKEFPTAFIIDADGKVAWSGNAAAIDEPLTKLLMEKPAKKAGFLAESSASESYKKAEKLAKDKKFLEAFEEYEYLTKTFKETKEAEKAAAELKKMKSNSKVMDMVQRAKAEREAGGWLDVARTCRQYGDKEDAIKYYERILKKYAETDAGRFARAEVATLKKPKKAVDEDEDDNGGKKKDKGKDKAKDKVKKDKEKKDKEEGDEESEEGDEDADE
jgi:thiol-disulfide isomerase/thioredoxin